MLTLANTTCCCFLSNCAYQVFFPASTCDVIIRHAHWLISITGRTCRTLRTCARVNAAWTSCNASDSRLFDFPPELIELVGRQSSVVVVVESLDEMQCAVLGKLEFRLQYADCCLETDEFLAAVHINNTHDWHVKGTASSFTVHSVTMSMSTRTYDGILRTCIAYRTCTRHMYVVVNTACDRLRQFCLSVCLSVTLELLCQIQTTKHISSTWATGMQISHSDGRMLITVWHRFHCEKSHVAFCNANQRKKLYWNICFSWSFLFKQPCTINAARILSGVHFFPQKSWRPFLVVALERRSITKLTKWTTPSSKSPPPSKKCPKNWLLFCLGVHLVCWGVHLQIIFSPPWGGGFRCTHCTTGLRVCHAPYSCTCRKTKELFV